MNHFSHTGSVARPLTPSEGRRGYIRAMRIALARVTHAPNFSQSLRGRGAHLRPIRTEGRVGCERVRPITGEAAAYATRLPAHGRMRP